MMMEDVVGKCTLAKSFYVGKKPVMLVENQHVGPRAS